MRIAAAILIVVQLLVRGAAAPHSHAEEGLPEPPHHASRPHFHLWGHSHPLSHSDHQRGHARDQAVPNRADHTPVHGVPHPPIHDHDRSAVYADGDTAPVAGRRVQVSELTETGWLSATLHSSPPVAPPRMVECRAAGPPRLASGNVHDLLPHLLRV